MTTQDRIRELAQRALRSPAPEEAVRPLGAAAPMPVMPAPAPQAVVPAPAASPVVAPVVTKAQGTPVTPQTDLAAAPVATAGSEKDLGTLIDERNRRLKRTWAWRRRTLGLAALAMLSVAGVWYVSSPGLQAKLQEMAHNFRKGKEDLTTLGSIVDTYQQQVDKIAVRGEQINGATTQLGVDPTKVDPNSDPNMEAEMKQLMGNDAVTPADRDRLLREKFGGLRKVAGGGQAGQAGHAGSPVPAAGSPAPTGSP